MSGCKKKLAEGQWWIWCGETDMGQTGPALCTHCGGPFILEDEPNSAELVRKAFPKC